MNGIAIRPILRRAALRCAMPMLRQAARAYVGGESLPQALLLRQRLADKSIGCTLGYFNADEEGAATITAEYVRALQALVGSDDYLSVKPPALGYEHIRLRRLADAAAEHGLRLHFDAHGPETAVPTRQALDRLLALHPPGRLGITLPGRWRRSLADAAWAIERGLPVRVVKGQWPDNSPERHSAEQGFLAVIDALAGRAAHVAVATHNVALAEIALERLQVAGTPCSLELLYGLPLHASHALAQRLDVPVRVYLAYGTAHLPYALGKALSQPHVIAWVLRDFVASWRHGGRI